MSAPIPDPELDAVCGAFLAAGARFVVIGGFAVVANGFVRATEDVDLLIPTSTDNDRACEEAVLALRGRWTQPDRELEVGELSGKPHSRFLTDRGLVDLVREGEPPLDFETVHFGAVDADLGAGAFKIAGLASLVAFKRLADRPRDRLDLEELRALHGELPIEPLPRIDM
jgi:hypothetical protein